MWLNQGAYPQRNLFFNRLCEIATAKDILPQIQTPHLPTHEVQKNPAVHLSICHLTPQDDEYSPMYIEYTPVGKNCCYTSWMNMGW